MQIWKKTPQATSRLWRGQQNGAVAETKMLPKVGCAKANFKAQNEQSQKPKTRGIAEYYKRTAVTLMQKLFIKEILKKTDA